MAQAPLLRDVITIKDKISTSDYVLSLAEAVTDEGAHKALQDYVVTDRLLDNFDEALGLIKAALDGHTSKAAYLHGSFGSGKSHFMAVLYALLSRNEAAWRRSEFDPVLTRHQWLGTDGKRFLLVPYHILGAKALEQRVLGGYVTHIRRLHPDAPIPQVYRTDALFDSVRGLRESMGDQAVLDALNPKDGAEADGGEEDEWGEPFQWTPERLEAALAAEESHDDGTSLNLLNPTTPAELRAKLVQDASTRLLRGFLKNAGEDEHGFISLDAGLSVIAAHAKSLGYDGLILFLDELVLWLATLIHDQKFVARESSKLTNLVEGADARRAIPVVSFIARQRDLRELVGEETAGAAEDSIQQSLNLASGRFDKITLEDRNLPQIANVRLLQPKEGKSPLIDEAFRKTKALGPNVWDTLLGSDKGATGADEESFRLSYPFSPAFMDTLVHISSALQRSRTGLKLMGQLLSDHRDELRLGDLIAVGDLYEVIAGGGDKPFTDSSKVVFDAADKLYRTKLRPYLLGSHEITEEDVGAHRQRPDTLDATTAQRCRLFNGDNRLICTLLLSALAPSVPALHDLTIRKLVALNHGSVVAMFPGGEVGIVKNKVDEWAARFPEIKPTGTTANPGVRLELSGIDVDSVIANAEVNNNRGNRSALIKRLLAEELGVDRTDGRLGADELKFVWKGSSRTVEVVFGNVADREEMQEHDLRPSYEEQWRIVVDLPYDEGAYGPVDDANRIQEIREQPGDKPRTVAWLPTHLSAQRFKDFGRLVTIDKALADGHRFATQYASHLSADNRERAKGLLESQREALLKQLREALKEAYGLKTKDGANVELDFDRHFQPVPDVPELTVKFGQSLHDAIRHIAGKLLAHQFPAHPDLDPGLTGTPVRVTEARTVFTHVRAAAESPERQVEIPAKDRKVMERLAGPLLLGRQKEAYFELSNHWADHFRRLASTKGVAGADLSMTKLLDWIDEPDTRGLEPFLAHLIVASFAEMDDRVWVRGSVPLEPAPDLTQIKPADALRNQPLPSPDDWEEARRRFEAIFGQPAPRLLRGRMVNQLARQLTEAARQHAAPAASLVERLKEHATFLALDETDEKGRFAVAHRSLELLTALQTSGQGTAGAKKTIEALARFDLRDITADRYGTSVKTAGAVASALVSASWPTLALATGQGTEGEALLSSLRGIAAADPRTADLPTALRETSEKIIALVRRNQARPPVGPGPQPIIPGPRPVQPIPPTPPSDAGDVPLDTDTSDPRITPASTPDTPVTAPKKQGTRQTTVSHAAEALRTELSSLPPNAVVELTWRVVER